MKLAAILFAAFLALAAAAQATPLTHNATDMWWDPAESGWGLNVIHQGDTLFATLFVYASDGKAHWYSAPALVTAGDGALHDRTLVFTGAVYESTGPAFAPTFDPAMVTRRQAGSMTFELLNDNSASLRYTIDGISVTKTVRRYTFRAMNLAGDFSGYQSQPASAPGGEIKDEMTISIRQSGSSISMTTQGSASGACTYSGIATPNGELTDVTGTYACADGRSGSFAMLDVDNTAAGFTARFYGNRIAPAFYGRMGGAFTSNFPGPGDGWRTDLWWVPTESGWGVNIIEQGDTLFATFFVYDAAGQAKWYVAPAVTYTGRGPAVDSTGVFTGTIYECTGPFFAAAFNPDTVVRRPVGTMSFDVYGNRTGLLDATINGVTLNRKILDRQTFRANDPAGSYQGEVMARLNPRTLPTGAASFNIVNNGDTFGIVMQFAGRRCTFTPRNFPMIYYGQQSLLSGPFTCDNGASGNLVMYDMMVTFSGFTASYDVDGYVVGNMAAVRSGVF